MRVLLQRVTGAAVTVVEDDAERESGRIGPGAVALVGFGEGDDEGALGWMAAKIADLRIFPSDGSGFELSLRETGKELLAISQFTLYGDARKGRRPDFGAAAPYAEAGSLYAAFVERCEAELPGQVAVGEFGALMRVSLVNDGPVTLWLER
ncbi:MAG: D-tyrosyl-tRNA(Tyr) deacylase [Gemmatimonadetes bacterium]|nr:D-tyrosyl-tRNA(Tyr) deacylase [Gemmatimonadota bacterium]